LAALAVKGRRENPALLRPGVKEPAQISDVLGGAAKERYARACDAALQMLVDSPQSVTVRLKMPGGAIYTAPARNIETMALAVMQSVEQDRQSVPTVTPGGDADPDWWSWDSAAARALYYRFLCGLRLWFAGQPLDSSELQAACPVPKFPTAAAAAGYARRLDEGRADALDLVTGNTK
jgi:hypothetical protein